ncbi:DUF6705 family protein [Elizabethkingia anophelis]|uniref:DUF6705 family protein n=1 Tax=Elizabethkingia anophelis TaxID=1117645 RepID=UPI0037303E39
MKKIIFLTVLLLSLYIQAQTISITDTPKKIPSGIYLKDMDNTLPLFSGMWVANFDGKQIILDISNRIDKYLKELSVNYYSDVLFIRYTIKDSNGNQVATTMNKAIVDANIISTYPSKDKKRIGFYYKGETCGIGNGLIGLTIIDETHISWKFRPLGGIIDPSNCSDYSPNIKSYIPRSLDLTFTKQ